MRDAWPNARERKNVSLIHTYHGFKGEQFCFKDLLCVKLPVSWIDPITQLSLSADHVYKLSLRYKLDENCSSYFTVSCPLEI
jgi:hypothetical protein